MSVYTLKDTEFADVLNEVHVICIYIPLKFRWDNFTAISCSLSDREQPGVFAGQCRKAAAEEPLVDGCFIPSLDGKRIDN